MAIFQGMSGEAEDRIVNTFHFVGPSTYAEMNPDCIDRVIDFYNGTNTNGTLSSYMSRWLNFEAEIRTYDLDVPKNQRVPSINPFTRAFATNNNGLPEEVAVCMTIHGVVPPALNRRRRGRLYFGPLNTSAMQNGDNNGPCRPSLSLITDLGVAGARLIAGTGQGNVYSIHSTVPSTNFVRVAAGYVDNAFDTQRRRGPDPTTKTPFGFPNL